MAGDLVLEIDGKSTDGMSIADAIKMLQGQEGTKVTLKVRHPSNQEETIAINRAQINVQTVKGIRRDGQNRWDFMLDNAHGIGYVRINQFTRSTAGDVRAALNQLTERGCKGLIIDLRFDPGGMLESAEQVSDMFLPAGKRIVSVKGRTTPEQVTMSKDQSDDVTVPMVVLANEASASAAEIVTGALSDNNRARFVGTRTFGKGSVQQVQTLDAGRGALKITTAYYYLPNGRNIHRRKDKDVWGVDPSPGCYVPMTPRAGADHDQDPAGERRAQCPGTRGRTGDDHAGDDQGETGRSATGGGAASAAGGFADGHLAGGGIVRRPGLGPGNAQSVADAAA